MSYKTEHFKAKQFDDIASLVNELNKKDAYLAEYGIKMKPEEYTQCLQQIFEKVSEPEPTPPQKDDRY